MKVISDKQVTEHLLATLNRESIVEDYIPALLGALSSFESNPSVSPERTVVSSNTPGSDTTHLFMPCIAPHGVGVKVISGGASNGKKGLGFQGSVMILDEFTGELRAVVNAKALTAFRTALASMLGLVKAIVPGDNAELLPELSVFGSGPQAYWHAVLAGRLYPQIKQINIISRSEGSGRKLASELRDVVDQTVTAFTLDDSAVESHVTNSSVVFGCTPSTEGIILDRYINTDARFRKYISLIGSYKPHMIELDLAFINKHYTGQNTKIIVDTKSGTLAEAGELIQGKIGEDQLVSSAELWSENQDIGQFITDTNVVVSKVVGLSIMDIVMAKFVMERTDGVVVEEF